MNPAKISLGIAGAGFAAITQIVTKDNLSPVLSWFVGISAFTIPIHIIIAIQDLDYTDMEKPGISRSFARFMFFVLLSGVGFSLLFFHFGFFRGVAFSVPALFVVLDILKPRSIRELGTNLGSIVRSVVDWGPD
jgi:hypothetical protein